VDSFMLTAGKYKAPLGLTNEVSGSALLSPLAPVHACAVPSDTCFVTNFCDTLARVHVGQCHAASSLAASPPPMPVRAELSPPLVHASLAPAPPAPLQISPESLQKQQSLIDEIQVRTPQLQTSIANFNTWRMCSRARSRSSVRV
jgi:hypothetical protein